LEPWKTYFGTLENLHWNLVEDRSGECKQCAAPQGINHHRFPFPIRKKRHVGGFINDIHAQTEQEGFLNRSSGSKDEMVKEKDECDITDDGGEPLHGKCLALNFVNLFQEGLLG